jgi:hypothetical protein
MFISIVLSLLAAGLLCLWISLISLSKMSRGKTYVIKPVPKPQEAQPKLTRLGRPIEPVAR